MQEKTLCFWNPRTIREPEALTVAAGPSIARPALPPQSGRRSRRQKTKVFRYIAMKETRPEDQIYDVFGGPNSFIMRITTTIATIGITADDTNDDNSDNRHNDHNHESKQLLE